MRRVWMTIIVTLLMASLVACASQTAPPAPPPSTPVPSPGQPPVPKPQPSPSSASQPKYGGTLSYFRGGEASGYDVHRNASYASYFTGPVFNSLVTFDPAKREPAPENIISDLAERWETSSDGKTITFYLRKGVKWHDGQPFTADDVVYSINKMVDPKRSSIVTNFAGYDRTEKLDDYTVKVYLQQPSPTFLFQLAMPLAEIQPKHKADVDWRTPAFLVGTGPFKFKSFVAGVSYDFVKNPDYFKKGLPYLDGLRINIVKDTSSQLDAFMTKRLDMTDPSLGINTQESLQRLQSSKDMPVIEWNVMPTTIIFWLNLQYAPLKDARVRRALAMLVQPAELTLAAFGSDKFRDFNTAFFTGAYGLSKPEYEKILGWDKPWDTRVADAKKLMADAGYASGFKLKLLVQSVPVLEKTFTALADVYRRYLNLDTEIVVREVAQTNQMRAAKDFHMYLFGPVGYPEEQMNYWVTGGTSNWTGYSNSKVDGLFGEQGRIMDPAKRRQTTQEIERILLTEVPGIPAGKMSYGVAWWPYVKGFNTFNHTYGPDLHFEKVWLDK